MEDRLRSIVVRIRRAFSARPRLVLAACVAAGIFLLLLSIPRQNVPPSHQTSATFGPVGATTSGELPLAEGIRTPSDDTKESTAAMPAGVPSKLYSPPPLDSASAYREPQVAYSAELTVATREFAHSRSSLEEILERHHGCVAKLRMVGEPTGSILSATLRVPSSEYRSALSELKGVGVVEHEEEAADEITQQHSELEARLVNAQNEEQRIQRILQNKDDKFSDIGSLERQVAALRAEIERIEAERSASSSRVSFANVFISLREERASTAETMGAKLRSAAIGGLNDALDSLSSILLFLAGHGPLLVLWTMLIYFPARYFWRRRSQWAFGEARAPKNS
ncbi:MAG: DUF4349 domain-containing protein [Candidatus Acidiferrum sp.]